ncbi:MAG TPA: DUF2188 domain-containing protein [Longimicrobiales bacterium]
MHQLLIVTRDGEYWSVNSRLAGVAYRFREREAALDFARRLAQRQPPAQIELRDEDGTIVFEEAH